MDDRRHSIARQHAPISQACCVLRNVDDEACRRVGKARFQPYAVQSELASYDSYDSSIAEQHHAPTSDSSNFESFIFFPSKFLQTWDGSWNVVFEAYREH